VEFEHRGNSDRGVRRKRPVLRLKLRGSPSVFGSSGISPKDDRRKASTGAFGAVFGSGRKSELNSVCAMF
jgi:hypothetical protein